MVNYYDYRSHSEKKEVGISFHSFPTDVKKRKLWIGNTKIKNWKPTKNDGICSNQFEECWLYKTDENSRVYLLHEAFPTIFHQFPTYLQPRKAKKRPPFEYIQSTEPAPSTSSTQSLNPTVDSPGKKKLKWKLLQEIVRSQEKTRKIRVLKQSINRLERKVVSLV